MRTIQLKKGNKSLTTVYPTREDISSLKVGDFAINCFGDMAEVAEIYAQKEDINGKMFVCYYTFFNIEKTSKISNSLKEGELCITTKLSNMFNSNEIREIQRELNRKVN